MSLALLTSIGFATSPKANSIKRVARNTGHLKMINAELKQINYPYWTVYPLMSTSVSPATVTNSSNQPFLFSEVGTQYDSDTYVVDGNPHDDQNVVTTPDHLLAVDSITSGTQVTMNVNYQGNTRVTTYDIQAKSGLASIQVFVDVWTFTDMIGGPPARVDSPSISRVAVQLGPPDKGGTGGGGQ